MFKLSSCIFLISVFIFGASCQSIKKTQSETTLASRSLAGLPKSPANISKVQFDQLKRREGEILSKLEGKPLKVAYSLLADEKTDRVCYVESFKTRNIVPSFAQPASYEEVRSIKKPPFPKCSGQEYSMMSSYQNASVLTDEDGVQVALLPYVAGAVSGAVASPIIIGGGTLLICSKGGSKLGNKRIIHTLEKHNFFRVLVVSCTAGFKHVYHVIVKEVKEIMQEDTP